MTTASVLAPSLFFLTHAAISVVSVPRWLRLLLKCLLTLGALTALGLTVDLDTLLDTLTQVHLGWLAVAGLLLPINLFLEGWVWQRLLRPVIGPVSRRELVRAVLSGFALGFWTPAQAGEYAARSFSLTTGDRGTISLTVFAQRMVDMAVGVLVGGLLLVGALVTGLVPGTWAWGAAALIGGGTGGILAVFIARPSRVHRLAQWLVPERPRLTERTAFFTRLTRRQGRDVLGGTVARYLVFTGQFVCLARALAPAAALSTLAVAAGLTFYAKYLIPSLTLLDLGIREGAAVFFFQQLGLGAAVGLNAALMLFTLNVLGPALLGLPFVLRLSFVRSEDQTVDAAAPSSLRSPS